MVENLSRTRLWHMIDFFYNLMYIAVLGSKEGNITFVNLETHEDFVMIKLKYSISKLEMITATTHKVNFFDNFQYFLLSKVFINPHCGWGDMESFVGTRNCKM